MNKEGSLNKTFMIMFVFMIASLAIVGLWDSFPFIKNSVEFILNPTAGALILWNETAGSMIVFFVISLISIIVQKYATDQKMLRELKKEQKEVNEEIKKLKNNPAKAMELQKEIWPTSLKIMEISMKGNIFTIIPFILLFRWFMDLFIEIGNPKFFGFLSWFWFYLITLIVFSSILRKILNVA